MSTTVLRTFEIYQKARVQFVQTVAELAKRKENFEALQSAGALLLLRPLLLDVVPSVAQTACIAIGTMAAESVEIAEEVINLEILPDIIDSISHQSRFYKKCAAFVLRSIARHNKELANAVVKAGGLQALGEILSEFDPSVKEAGCWAISYIAKHDEDLAKEVINHVSVKDLVLCIQEPEIGLRRIAANALMQIARHKMELAREVAKDEYALLPFLAPLISHGDKLLKRQVIACFSHIAYHTQALSEQITHYVDVPNLIARLKDEDQVVRINTAQCINNIVSHKADSARLICNKDGPKALVEYINENHGAAREPALQALSSIAFYEDSMALSIITCKGIDAISDCLINERDPNIKMKAAKTLECIGHHSETTAKSLAEKNILRELRQILIEEENKIGDKNEKLQDACKSALKSIIQRCMTVQPLDDLIDEQIPNEVFIQVLKQLAKILPSYPTAKKSFAESGGLRKILIKKSKNLKESDKKTIIPLIDDVKNLYPSQMIQFYDPDYEKSLWSQLPDSSKPNP